MKVTVLPLLKRSIDFDKVIFAENAEECYRTATGFINCMIFGMNFIWYIHDKSLNQVLIGLYIHIYIGTFIT